MAQSRSQAVELSYHYRLGIPGACTGIGDWIGKRRGWYTLLRHLFWASLASDFR